MIKPVYLFILLLIAPFLRGKGQNEIDYAVHANIIYHFTKYIDWPVNRKTGDFIIGIIGNSPLFDELKKISSGKTVGNQKIVIKKFPVGQEDYDSHILFVPSEESDNLKKIAAKTHDLPILLIGEEEGMSQQGTCINFAIVKDRLKLEINKNNIESRHMNIASELLSLGKIVK